jgi:hypothetical protein
MLARFCSETTETRHYIHGPRGPKFHYETTSNRGWVFSEKDPYVLLIDFNESSAFMVHKSLFSLESAGRALGQPGQVDMYIKGPGEDDEGMWIRNAPVELCGWLDRYGGGNSSLSDDAYL